MKAFLILYAMVCCEILQKTPPYTDELQIFQSKMIRSQGLALNCNVNFILHNKSILNRVKTCCMLCYMYVLQWNDMAKRIYEINALMYEIPILCYVVCCKIFAWTYFTYIQSLFKLWFLGGKMGVIRGKMFTMFIKIFFSNPLGSVRQQLKLVLM